MITENQRQRVKERHGIIMGYILITGGNLINKGAQAMTFIAVDEIKRRFPDREVVVISDVDAARS